MPELPEVETVRRTLEQELVGHTIKNVQILYPSLIVGMSKETFQETLKNVPIQHLKRRGKWLIFEFPDQVLLSHLRMEGKYLFRSPHDPVQKHEHALFTLEDGRELRYQDTRKFGRMYLLKKGEYETMAPLKKIGKEPWDTSLTVSYLKEVYIKKSLPIKTALLDQSIIAGIGNIYANEILFLCHLSPFKKCCDLTKKDLQNIIDHTKTVLEEAIKEGGTTIKSYTSSEGVHGRFQQKLFVHGKEKEECMTCHHLIEKTKVNGRGTYYCPYCQK